MADDPRSSTDEAPQPSLATAPEPGRSDEELRRLGEALDEQSGAVLQRTIARTHAESGEEAEGSFVRVSFERICTLSTHAVAQWMAGGHADDLAISGEEAWGIFGQLVAHRAIPLNEVTKRCLRWRDAARDELTECAQDLDVSPQTLAGAIAVVQANLDATLVGMCEVFENERKRTDEELAHRQEELAFMATHDPLTGLPNRTLILDRCEQMLMRARRHKSPVAALLINIDNFKTVNDTLGHGVGDELLRAVTARLDGIVRDTDALGRIGADEFAVVAEEISLAAGPELIAERVLQALSEPFELTSPRETRLTITASVGISLGDRATAEEMLHDADIAMHRAKWDGKDRYVVFESGMRAAVQVQMELEMDLRDALKNGEYFLVYQPTFDLRAMRPTGMEALLRWNNPARGVVQPSDFIPVLEETGLISQVGRWILEEACAQAQTWVQAGHDIGMAVNVSGRQLDSDDLVVSVRRALDKSGLDPGALTLEITETTLMRNAEETARRLGAIKALGVRVAIDDFGTGYSSLAHLQQFPVDALKIDRSFISRLKDNPEGETLIHTLVQLGKALSIETLAEGIEQQDELTILQEEQCDSGQGFLFARPLDVAAAEEFLNTWPGEPSPAPPPHVPAAAVTPGSEQPPAQTGHSVSSRRLSADPR
ncbi:MAG TPA: EAL domain-containing protein [Solirubrobacteraceae bacterium]|nr:EAL domain-containing protein [Solirubrobacteraceae bacterium]